MLVDDEFGEGLVGHTNVVLNLVSDLRDEREELEVGKIVHDGSRTAQEDGSEFAFSE
jgi:hypothetical protein